MVTPIAQCGLQAVKNAKRIAHQEIVVHHRSAWRAARARIGLHYSLIHYSLFTTHFARTPQLPKPCRMIGFLEDSTRLLTPLQLISPDSRPYSIFGHRFMMTLIPAASAFAAASSWRTVSCIQSTFGNGFSARTSLEDHWNGVRIPGKYRPCRSARARRRALRRSSGQEFPCLPARD